MKLPTGEEVEDFFNGLFCSLPIILLFVLLCVSIVKVLQADNK